MLTHIAQWDCLLTSSLHNTTHGLLADDLERQQPRQRARGRLCGRPWLSNTTAARLQVASSTHFGGEDGRSPFRRGWVQPRDYYFHDNLGQFLEANSWSSKTEFLEIGNFWLLVVVRVKIRALSHREIMFHVWKYIRTIIIGQYAVCGLLLDN